MPPFLLIWILCPLAEPLCSEPLQNTNHQLKAALVLKVVELEAKLSSLERGLTIYVLGAPKIAEALQDLVGKPIGSTTLGKVLSGEGKPASKPDIIFMGTSNEFSQVLAMARSQKYRADLFRKGVSVSILTENRKPKITLNPDASLREGLTWDLDFTQFRSLVLEFKKN